MEIIPEGRNFRLVNDEELPNLLNVLEKHLPYSLKVIVKKKISLKSANVTHRDWIIKISHLWSENVAKVSIVRILQNA